MSILIVIYNKFHSILAILVEISDVQFIDTSRSLPGNEQIVHLIKDKICLLLSYSVTFEWKLFL